MNCKSCKNKDLCKFIDDMNRLTELSSTTSRIAGSPVTLEVVCKRYQSELQGTPRVGLNPSFDALRPRDLYNAPKFDNGMVVNIENPTKETIEEISNQVIKEIRENNRKLTTR